MEKNKPSLKSEVVMIRIAASTKKELARRAKHAKMPIGSYVRQLLEDYAPGRETDTLAKNIVTN